MKSKILLFSIVAICQQYIFTPSGIAQSPSTSINAPGGEILSAVVRLEPWFAKIDRQLEQKSESVKDLNSSLGESRLLTCSFSVNKTGEISGLKIEKSSGVSSIDTAALRLLTEAVPFDPCPNNVPIKRGMQCEFTVDRTGTKIFSKLNPSNRLMYFRVDNFGNSTALDHSLRIGAVSPRL